MRVSYDFWQAAIKLTFFVLLVMRDAAAAAGGLIEIHYDRIGVTQITVSGSRVTRTDRVCGSDSAAKAPASCRNPKSQARSWALTEEESAGLVHTLTDSGFLQDADAAATTCPKTGDILIEVSVQQPSGIQTVRRIERADQIDSAFSAIAGALTSLSSPKLATPLIFRGALPQRADVTLVMGADGRYELTIKVVALRARPTGGATENGHWQFDPQQSRLLLAPDHPKGLRRAADLTGGRKPRAILLLDGYFPPGTTVVLGSDSQPINAGGTVTQ